MLGASVLYFRPLLQSEFPDVAPGAGRSLKSSCIVVISTRAWSMSFTFPFYLLSYLIHPHLMLGSSKSVLRA